MLHEELHDLERRVLIVRRQPEQGRPLVPVHARALRLFVEQLTQALDAAVVGEVPDVGGNGHEKLHDLPIQEMRGIAEWSPTVVFLDWIDRGATCHQSPGRLYRI